jgi:hypothetical protein
MTPFNQLLSWTQRAFDIVTGPAMLPPKRNRRRRDSEDDEPAQMIRVITPLLYENGDRQQCPIPECGKIFKTLPSYKYHANNHVHDLRALLEWAYFGDGLPHLAPSNDPAPESMHAIDVLQQHILNGPAIMARMLPIELKNQYFMWHGHGLPQTCGFIFGGDILVTRVNEVEVAMTPGGATLESTARKRFTPKLCGSVIDALDVHHPRPTRLTDTPPRSVLFPDFVVKSKIISLITDSTIQQLFWDPTSSPAIHVNHVGTKGTQIEDYNLPVGHGHALPGLHSFILYTFNF